jgi:excisionase family DNA binding protein
MSKEEFPKIMTIAQVAKFLGLHELTVRRLARDGELPAFKLGRQWRIKKDLLEGWIETRSLDNVKDLSENAAE